MRILISGSVAANGGDRAIMEAQCALLRAQWPECEISVHDNLPAVARRVLDVAAVDASVWERLSRPWHSPAARVLTRVRRRLLLLVAPFYRRAPGLVGLISGARGQAALAQLAGYDLVVYTGGTSLVESYDLSPKFYELQLACRLGIPVTLMTQSVGPFAKPANQRRIRAIAAHSRLVLLRDQRSADNLVKIGATGRREILRDVVFSRVDEAAVRAVRSRRLPATRQPWRVGISVRRLDNLKNAYSPEQADVFLDSVAALAERLLADGAEVTFVSTCQGVPEYWTDDSTVASGVVTRLKPDAAAAVRLDTSFHTTDDLIELLAGFDAFVSTRLHGAILSLAAGTLVLPVAYEFKTKYAFDDLGAGDWVVDARTVDQDGLVAGWEHFCATADARRPVLAERLAAAAADAGRAGELTAAAVR